MRIRNIKQLLKHKDNIQLIKNVAGNYMVKGGAMIVSLLLTPAYMSYFPSQTLLGMWFTAIALLNWLMLFDFGIGGGIRNQLVAPLAQNDKQTVREILSAGYFSVGAIVVVLVILQYFIVPLVDWYVVFGISPTEISKTSLDTVVHILVSGILIRFFTVLISHVFYAMQKATVPGLLILISNILILVYIWISDPSGTEKDIIRLAVVQALATNLPTIAATAILFCGKLRRTFPTFSALKFSRVKSILGSGTGLFYLQILLTLVFGVKEIFITWFAGTAQVVDYNIYLKLIGVVATLFSLALTPVWSAVTKDYVDCNYQRIRKLYTVGIGVMLAFGMGQLLLIALLPYIAEIWLGSNAIAVSRTYAAVYSLYNLIYMWTMLNYNFACGMGRVKVIAVCLTMAAIINVALSYWWCAINPSWIMVIAATAVASIPCAMIVPKYILRFKT